MFHCSCAVSWVASLTVMLSVLSVTRVTEGWPNRYLAVVVQETMDVTSKYTENIMFNV